MPQATEITRWSKASDVRDALVRETRVERWNQGPWWREFLTLRRNFFADEDISDSASEDGKSRLEQAFCQWVRNNPFEWWAQGGWVEHAGFAEWHVTQYLRANKETHTKSVKKHVVEDDHVRRGSNCGYWDPARAAAATF